MQVSFRGTSARTALRSSRAVAPRMSTVRVQAAIKPGDVLPDFELETDASTSAKKVTIKSKDMVKDSGAVIFFYPRANTSGCTLQACQFRDNYGAFEAKGYKVYGMSNDGPEAQASWKRDQALPYPLLCDTDNKVMSQLGVYEGGKVQRTHLVIAKGGKVEDAQVGVGSKDSVPKALQFVQTLKI